MNINFFGDISLYKINYSNFKISADSVPLFEKNQINVANLECPVTTARESEANQIINMNAPAKSLELLKDFMVLSLANNHIRDFSTPGVLDTIEAVERLSFRHFGAGRTVDEAIRPVILSENGIRVAIFGATRYANASNKNGAGTAPDRLSLLKREIKKHKKEKCFVVIYFHWGYEYVRIPSPRERDIAHACIDAGADLIVGSHPHIYQGIERYKGKSIVYSLGNFIFHSSVYEKLSPLDDHRPLRESFVFSVKISDDFTYTTSLHGYELSDNGVEFYDQKRNRQLNNEVRAISEIFDHSSLKYKKEYYKQAYDISEQNIRMRADFLNAKELDIKNRLSLYLSANLQDLKNRLAHLIIKKTKFLF